jgi:hypothetical protein
VCTFAPSPSFGGALDIDTMWWTDWRSVSSKDSSNYVLISTRRPSEMYCMVQWSACRDGRSRAHAAVKT